MKNKILYDGNYVTITEMVNGDIKLTASKAARADFGRYGQVLLEVSEHYALWELLEDITENSSWNFVAPEDIGALTAAPILSNDVTIDDDGAVVVYGDIWWQERYAVESAVEKIFRGGCIFNKAGVHDEN